MQYESCDIRLILHVGPDHLTVLRIVADNFDLSKQISSGFKKKLFGFECLQITTTETVNFALSLYWNNISMIVNWSAKEREVIK